MVWATQMTLRGRKNFNGSAGKANKNLKIETSLLAENRHKVIGLQTLYIVLLYGWDMVIAIL